VIDVQKLRYLAVGGVNTVVGYGIGVAAYQQLVGSLHIFVIGILANIVAITFSFLTYKTLVFRTNGHWLQEYLKAYVVYGGVAVFGIVLLWLFVNQIGLSIWIAQGLVTMLTVAVSYIGHKRYTFSKKAPVDNLKK
jgi:putative flippase GtrA